MLKFFDIFGQNRFRQVTRQNVRHLDFFFYYNYQTSSVKPMKKFIYKLIQGLIKDVLILIHKD